METSELLERVRGELSQAFGDRLRGVILYGSEARGQALPDSDIDLLVLLAGPVDRGADLWTCIHSLYPLVLEMDRPIHPKPVDVEAYRQQKWPLYRRVQEEGIPA